MGASLRRVRARAVSSRPRCPLPRSWRPGCGGFPLTTITRTMYVARRWLGGLLCGRCSPNQPIAPPPAPTPHRPICGTCDGTCRPTGWRSTRTFWCTATASLQPWKKNWARTWARSTSTRRAMPPSLSKIREEVEMGRTRKGKGKEKRGNREAFDARGIARWITKDKASLFTRFGGCGVVWHANCP